MNRLILPLLFFALFCCLSSSLAAQETGIAEVYPSSFKGKLTSSGSEYKPEAMTAAHKMHGIGTMLRVTRTDEAARRWTMVKVNDRGPYTSGHIIALSKAAAQRLGIDENSTATVVIEVISQPYSNNTSTPKTSAEPPQKVKVNTAPPAAGYERASDYYNYSTSPASSQFTEKGTQATPQTKPAAMPVVRQGYTPFGLYKIALQLPKRQGFGVQVMSLSRPENLLEQIALLQQKWFDDVLVSIEPGGGFSGTEPVYKIILGPFPTEQQAKIYKDNLKQKFKMDGFVVDLGEIPR